MSGPGSILRERIARRLSHSPWELFAPVRAAREPNALKTRRKQGRCRLALLAWNSGVGCAVSARSARRGGKFGARNLGVVKSSLETLAEKGVTR